MKKLYTLFFIFFISISISNSQWVTIPDTNFVAFLQQNYPQCMNGNQMDTTCSAIVNATYLGCGNKNISDLTGLQYFDGLQYLDCQTNQLTFLPTLPTTLIEIWCFNNFLTSLPTLPATLTNLLCQNNQLNSLPNLPASLQNLGCDYNQLTFLPALPSSLTQLTCWNNQLTSLPTLPISLSVLRCPNNLLSNLPSLPASLTFLECNDNLITTLPTLPSGLNVLICNNNLISSLPTLPNSVKSLDCSNNNISFLPELPDTLNYLIIKDNPNLMCLPKLNNINSQFLYFNTGVQCLPNYPNIISSNPLVNPPIFSIALCDIFNNPNNCDIYWNISGKVYNDNNNNCINDTNEQGFSNLKLLLFENGNLIQQVYSGNEGLYSFDTDTGTFTYTVDTTDLPVYVTCPVSGFHTSLLTPLDSMDYNMDFAMQCKPGFDVGVKNIVRTSGQFFPANFATIKIGAGDMASFYGLTCAGGISGTVIINFTGPISFISEVPSALIPVVNGNILTYSIPDFSLINFNSDFRIIIQTDTTAQAGDQVCFTVNVTPTAGDNDVTNNSLQHCFTVVNSFDPNSKEVYPEGGLIPNQEWMTYTIHFQNTGNAPAQNIYVLDTLDQNLIASSFTLLSYSHEPLTQLFGNVIKFNFPNINLPDSTNDEPNSHGFVQYKVKMVQGLPVGTVISNTAYNYFDFNSPVATNTVSNMVGLTSISNSTNKIDISVFPNPTYDELSILFNLNSSSEIKIELYNSLGQIVKVVSKENYEAGKNLINFSVINIPVGVYHLKFLIDGNMMIKKVIKY